MYSLQTVIIVVVILYYIITRGFPKLLSWLIVAKYQTEIKIGWISLLRLSFEDVLIKKSGLSIKVERIGATSSLFNQDERKIFAIKIHDVRIEKELIGSVTGAQVQVLQHAGESDKSGKSGSGGGTLEGRRGGTQSVGESQDPSLMECAGSLKLSVEVNADAIASMENISVQLSQPQITLRDRLITFLEHKAMATTPMAPNLHHTPTTPHHTSPEALLHRYWLFLPLKFQCKVEEVSVKLLNGVGGMALQGALAAIDLQTHLNREGALENLPALLPDFSTELQVDNTRVQGSHHTLLSLNRFNLQTQFIGDRVNMKSEFRWLHVSYDDRDLAVWTNYLGCLRAPPQPYLPPPVTECQPPTSLNNNHQNSTSSTEGGYGRAFLRRYCVGVIVEAWDVSCGGTVGGASQGRTSLQHARFSVLVSQEVAQVAGELILESLVATLGSVGHSEVPLVSSTAAAAAPKRTHIWGTPAYVGMCLVQLSSSGGGGGGGGGGAVESLPPLQAEALVDNVQLEWSPELATLLAVLVRYVQKVKSYMRRRKGRKVVKESQGDGEVLSNVSAKCTNINVFTVSERKVSIMARVDSLESQKSGGNSKTLISGTKLLRFVPSGTQYSCVKSSEIRGECGQVSEVVVRSVNDEILVNVSGQLHLTWSTTTHMTLLTLGQEVAAFLTSIRPLEAEAVEEQEAGVAGGTQEEGGGGGEEEEQEGLKLQILARGDLRIGAELSRRHHVYFILGFHGTIVTVNHRYCHGHMANVTVNQGCHGQGNVTVNQGCHGQGNVTVNQVATAKAMLQ
ncbi:hypothetical protein GWK47_023223 [Chionoecetes opilio]|uniref:Uncharacterized protein n=1 Tax=Chionoecetes opilio TaxID=41210 RepID=A0A8J5CJT6_CHIOP|nr:hypothetical protein GWK47_023223 [Chionoecetes opilio]